MDGVIERLRADAEKMRTDKHNTAWRWLDDVRKWRYKRQIAEDIEALIKGYQERH